jgi:fructose-1,6-bisphosphatase/inositol monophosphatase family enzyme
MVDEAACVELAVALAVAAGELIREALEQQAQQRQTFSLKSENDHVTAVDEACERLIVGGLKARFPSHHVIGEEATGLDEVPPLTNQPTWMVDPLDGTTNFVHGVPHCAVSIGLCMGGRPVVGVVRDPMRQETFVARRGSGAYLNNQLATASPERALAGAVMSIEWPSSAADRTRGAGSAGAGAEASATARQLAVLGRLLEAPSSLSALRGGGSCVLDMAWVACGRLDLTYRGHVGCDCWDVCGRPDSLRNAAIICNINGFFWGALSIGNADENNEKFSLDICY